MKVDAKIICSVEGCGRSASYKDCGCLGFCAPHYGRFYRYGDPLAGGTARGAPLAWLMDHAGQTNDECSLWPFGQNGNGYGKINYDGTPSFTHRIMCTWEHGAPPSPDHDAAHSCGNRSCINPRHLSWKTRKENEADKLIHETQSRGENISTILTEAQVKEIYQRTSQREKYKTIAADFGISRHVVGHIKLGNTWAWLTGATQRPRPRTNERAVT